MNRGPLDLQSNALPLSYTPTHDIQFCYYDIYSLEFLWVMNTCCGCAVSEQVFI